MTEALRAYRPEETRQRLIEAGLRLFGISGLEAISTRQLVEAAQVSLNAIHYHFGSKDDVYLAVARHLTETTGADIKAAAEEALAGVDSIVADEAVERLAAVLVAVVRTILGAPDSAHRGGFILREQLQPSSAFGILHDGFVGRLHEVLAKLIASALSLDADAPATIIRAHAMLGQALVFGMARETLARRLGHAAITADHLTLILNDVATLTRDAITGAAIRLGAPHASRNKGD